MEWISDSEKVALHMHTDELWYTPERHTVTEIESVYKRSGYSVLGFTEYGAFQKPKKREGIVSGYEWGFNLRKRHALSFGGEETVSDFFPIYASRENVNWAFQKMQRLGSYVVIAHPKLGNTFSREDLVAIDFYNGIEVFSPFGDDTKPLDILLSKGRNIHCMATDDLHYFAETTIASFDQPLWKNILQHVLLQRGRKSQSLLRYIVLADKRISESLVMADLKAGAFFCVKKLFREAEDPKIPKIKVDAKNKIKLLSNERYLEIRWIGENGELKKADPDTNQSEYQMTEMDPFIRLEIRSLSGTILSNAIYRAE
jgi:hypothetical protein